MKRTLGIALLLAANAAFAADTLRTDRHLVKIEAQATGANSKQFNVQVFDAESRNHVAHLKLVTKGDVAEEGETASGATQYKVRVQPYGESYLVDFSAEDGAELNERMRGGFSLKEKKEPVKRNPKRSGRDVSEPAVLQRIEPVYTEDAKAAGAAGTVIVEVVIDRSGFVQEATVVKPMGYGLSESAAEAVKQWRFEPVMDGRTPVEVVHEVTVEFKP